MRGTRAEESVKAAAGAKKGKRSGKRLREQHRWEQRKIMTLDKKAYGILWNPQHEHGNRLTG